MYRHIWKFDIIMACLFIGISVVVAVPFLYINTTAFAQGNPNISKSTASTNITALPKSGLQLLLYTKNGGFAGLNQIFSYNIVTKELTFVDLRNNTVKTKMLNDSEIANLTDTFFSAGIIKGRVYDLNVCPDCFQYGMSYSFIEPEKLLTSSEMAFWTSNTKGAEYFAKVGEAVERLAPK
jgi:hypothetical protein